MKRTRPHHVFFAEPNTRGGVDQHNPNLPITNKQIYSGTFPTRHISPTSGSTHPIEALDLSNPPRRIRVTPLAAESFGVRSMCTHIETPDIRILVDPGVSLGMRFSLLPHPREYRALRECRDRLADNAERADVVTISHYHFDHYTPSYTDYVWHWSSLEVARQIYRDKLVLAKGIRDSINTSQRRRGWMLRKTVERDMKELVVADGKDFSFGGTRLSFSRPVFHGEKGTELGWVLMLTVAWGDEEVLYAPDVQGPMVPETLNLMMKGSPKLVIVGGPPLYLSGFRVDERVIAQGMESLVRLAQRIPVMILEHHLLRDENWLNFSRPVFEAAEGAGHRVVTAAEFMGEPNRLLEFRRRVLYEVEPPSEEFMRWTRLPRMRQVETMPPP